MTRIKGRTRSIRRTDEPAQRAVNREPRWSTLGYRREVGAAHRRLADLHPQVAPTSTGQVQYATRGTGPDVLSVHGIMGGCDAGLRLAAGLLPDGYRLIAPSRFGYLGTPMPAGASVAAQADAHAALLDALGMNRVAVLGASAGGASALQLAIRHPERVNALVLVSSVAPGPYRPPLPRPLARLLWGSDLLMWAVCRLLPGTITGLMGVPKDLPLRPEDHAIIAEELGTLLPVSQRVTGALFDQFVSNADINSGYRFDQITAPTLVIHAKDQPGYKGIPGGDAAAAAMAELIPGAKMLSVDHGGHLLLGDHPEIRAAVGELLAGAQSRIVRL
jgi:pimeloyl-ACP methyl ester carboxylesterase